MALQWQRLLRCRAYPVWLRHCAPCQLSWHSGTASCCRPLGCDLFDHSVMLQDHTLLGYTHIYS
jgi:hypothetical protein